MSDDKYPHIDFSKLDAEAHLGLLRETMRGEVKKTPAQPTELYRHFDSEGRLLYVGISLSVLHRLRAHRRISPWFSQVTNITIERFETRDLALAAEKVAIKTERPKFNVMLTGSRLKPPDPPPMPLAETLRKQREKMLAERDGQ